MTQIVGAWWFLWLWVAIHIGIVVCLVLIYRERSDSRAMRLRRFARHLLLVHEYRTEEHAEAILDSVERGYGGDCR